MKKLISTSFLFLSVFLSPLVYACSCVGQINAGFIHASTKVLPANAKGVLFLSPFSPDIIHFEGPGEMIVRRHQPPQISANDFEIFSGESKEKIAATIQYLQPFDSSVNSENAIYTFNTDKLEHDFLKKKSENVSIKRLIKQKLISKLNNADVDNLIRVSPINGFKVGQTYTVRYLGKASEWSAPSSIEVTIDNMEFDAQKSQPRLLAEGGVQLEALAQATRSGSCSSIQVSQVQRLSFPLDSQMEKYKEAITIFRKTNLARPSPYFMAPEIDFHSRSLCSRHEYGKTSSSDQHEMLVARCGIETQDVMVDALVGFLEVEDKLRATNSINVSFKKIPAENCNGFHLLNEALRTNNIDQVKANLCALPKEEARWYPNRFPLASLPDVNAIWNLRNTLNIEERPCLTAFLERVISESKETPTEAITYYKDVLLSLLSSNDPSNISQAQETFRNLDFGLSVNATESSNDEPRKQILLKLLKPELLDFVENGTALQTETAGIFLGELANADQATIDRLFKVSKQDMNRAGAATRALAHLLPDNPQLHELLVEQINEPTLLENASLLYAKVAGKQNPKQAVDFLIKASIAESQEAMSRFPDFKDNADAAIPFLVGLLSYENSERRDDALRILIQLYRGQAQIIQALKQSLRVDSNQVKPPFPIYYLRDLGAGINLLKPEIAHLSVLPMSRDDKDSLKRLIRELKISKSEKNKMMKNLKDSVAIED